MPRRLGVALGYVAAALVIAGLWTYRAKTENQGNRFASIVAIADGTAPRPFVKRRLLCDAARGVAWSVPGGVWRTVSDAVDRHPVVARLVRGRLGWERDDEPLLVSATALIALAAAGFMAVMRGLMVRLYEAPGWLASLSGLLLGLALLGGGGDERFGFYPYDLPHAFLFALTLAAILARSAWAFPAFTAAAYSKETALLLVPACLLARRGWPDRRAVWTAAALGLTFVAVRGAIDARYGPGVGGFWFPGRNARWLAWAFAFDAWWYLPFLVVAAVRLARHWHAFPEALRRWTLLAVPLLGSAFFKGWVEEKRQYLELLPILGPLLIQWVVIELGGGDLLRARGGADVRAEHAASVTRRSPTRFGAAPCRPSPSSPY